MGNFKKWFEGLDFGAPIKDMGGGIVEGGKQKAMDYAKRIIAGEDPEVVMQGIGKIMRQMVWDFVKQLQGKDNPSEFSVSKLEASLGVDKGTFEIKTTRDGKHVIVRHRPTGRVETVPPDPKSIEAAARSLI